MSAIKITSNDHVLQGSAVLCFCGEVVWFSSISEMPVHYLFDEICMSNEDFFDLKNQIPLIRSTTR